MTDGSPAKIEVALQRLVTVDIITSLLFLLLPKTFLGVWNLVSISGRHSLADLSASWLQTYGHAQIFGWIGTFVIGIGYYSLSKMGRLVPLPPAVAGYAGLFGPAESLCAGWLTSPSGIGACCCRPRRRCNSRVS